MGIGKHVGSKLDRSGSTFASRHEAIKAASRLAVRAVEAADARGTMEHSVKTFAADVADRGSRFGKGLKGK